MGSWQERQEWNNQCWMGKQYVNDRAMTDEQLELLRRQIAAYITICEQLAEMHNAISTSTQQDRGTRLGNEPWMAAAGEKRTAKRWSSTPLQLQILERIFEEGNGTPSKQRIKEITTELAQHGQISEANVYNWFQNRRARLKRMQSVSEANMWNQNLRHKLNL